MPNKLNITLSVTLSHPTGSVSLRATAAPRELTGTGYVAEEQTIGTSWELIDLTDVGTLGFLMVHNKDETNYVQIATANDDSGIFGKILPGGTLPVDVQTGATYYLKANTAPVNVDILATEA